MPSNIIQHHNPFDFESLLERIRSRYLGLDYQDFSNILHTAGEKHSFIGYAEGTDRVKAAVENAIDSDVAFEIISHASSVMIIIIRSSEAEYPLTIEEMQYLNGLITKFSKHCEVVWELVEDSTLGNAVGVFLLANINM